MTTLSPAAAASLDTVDLPAPVNAASLPAIVLASAVIEDAEPAHAELLLAESVLDAPDFFESLVSDYGDPIKVLRESIGGVETPDFSPTVATETPTLNPEPASLLLLGTGLGLMARRLRRREQPAGK